MNVRYFCIITYSFNRHSKFFSLSQLREVKIEKQKQTTMENILVIGIYNPNIISGCGKENVQGRTLMGRGESISGRKDSVTEEIMQKPKGRRKITAPRMKVLEQDIANGRM